MSTGEFMPTDALRECTWTLQERQTAQYSRGGNSQVIDLGDPFWTLTATYEGLGPAQFKALSAFISRRQGARVTFAARRPGRKPDFAQDPVGLGFVVTSGKLRIDAGATPVVAGDMVSYTTSGSGRYIGEVQSTSVVSGTNLECVMRPLALAAHATPDVAIVGAWGLFRLDPQSVQISETYDPRKRVSFSARQVEP